MTDLEQKLQVGVDKLPVKGAEGVEPKEEMEVKSKNIGSSISTPSKRKSKKKSEATTSQASSSSSEVHIQTTTVHASSAMNFESILGVAGVSIIF
ncbi:Laminin-like protein [Arachis hypogaea]|nr:Laminin-like protein [Arachis hypogaea]